MPAYLHTRRNFVTLLIDAAGWPLGMSFLSMQVILPGYLGTMGAGNVLIGLVPALANLGAFLPPLFIAAWVERRPYVRHAVFWLAVAERVPILAMALCTWLLGARHPGLTMALFFVFWGANNLVMGFNIPVFLSLVAKTSSPERRGLLYGLGGALGGLLGAAGAVLSRSLLLGLGFPDGYAACFGIGFVILMLTILPFPLMDEPRHEPASGAPRLREHLRGLPRTLRADPGFARYILAQNALVFATVAFGFFAVFAGRRLGAGEGQLGVYNAILMGTASLAGPVLGAFADRAGNRAVLTVSALAAALASSAALYAVRLPSLMIAAFFLTAAANAGLGLAGNNIVLEYAGVARTATYTAMAMGLTVPLRFGVPILAGLAADRYGYPPVFIVSAVFAVLAAALLRLGVPEPRGMGRAQPVSPAVA